MFIAYLHYLGSESLVDMNLRGDLIKVPAHKGQYGIVNGYWALSLKS